MNSKDGDQMLEDVAESLQNYDIPSISLFKKILEKAKMAYHEEIDQLKALLDSNENNHL